MSDTIKCLCEHCGAKYRLPMEAQGRTARCKRCGEKFQVPKQQSLEDSILTWLANPEDEEDDLAPSPKVISMPESESGGDGQTSATARKTQTVRMKKPERKEESA